MAFKHLCLLAVSLTVATIGTSCVTPIDTSNNGVHGSAKELGLHADSSQSDLEQRRAALVAHWLANARTLGSRGQFDEAYIELLKARDMAPRNQMVVAELARAYRDYGVGQMPWPTVLKRRALATVQHQLQVAEQLLSDQDYAGAIDELRRAALGIEIKNDIDWGDLPTQVHAALDQAQRLYDAQERERKALEQRPGK